MQGVLSAADLLVLEVMFMEYVKVNGKSVIFFNTEQVL